MNNNNSTKIGVATASIVGINAMIGAGIFSVPAALASSVGPAGILTYAFVIVSVYFMASSIARLAELFPQEGSFYTYTKQWGGHTMGVIAAGAYLIGLLIAMGLLSQMAGKYLHVLFSTVSDSTLGIITLTSLVLLNIVGVSMSQASQIVLVCCTIFPLITTIAMCFLRADLNNLTPFMPYGLGNVLSATRAVIFGFFGFECAASLFNVVENPRKNVPKALTYSIMVVGTLYLLFVASLILAIPLHHFSDPTVPLSSILKVIFPHNVWIINVIHLSILSAIIGTIHSMIWSSSALLLSYVKHLRSPIFKRLITNNILTHRTAVLIVGLCIFASYTTIENPNLFFSLTAVFIVFAYATSIITLLTLPAERKFGQAIKTIIGLTTASVIFYFALEGVLAALFKI